MLKLNRNVILFKQILELYVKKYVKKYLNDFVECIKIIYYMICIFNTIKICRKILTNIIS